MENIKNTQKIMDIVLGNNGFTKNLENRWIKDDTIVNLFEDMISVETKYERREFRAERANIAFGEAAKYMEI